MSETLGYLIKLFDFFIKMCNLYSINVTYRVFFFIWILNHNDQFVNNGFISWNQLTWGTCYSRLNDSDSRVLYLVFSSSSVFSSSTTLYATSHTNRNQKHSTKSHSQCKIRGPTAHIKKRSYVICQDAWTFEINFK